MITIHFGFLPLLPVPNSETLFRLLKTMKRGANSVNGKKKNPVCVQNRNCEAP
jgi:hypothetical protein